MSDWKSRLADVDDDYLVGISNKGIVKRAYKDKEEAAAEIVSMEEEASIKIGEETVTVCFPLGKSKCTCPSRSICRHVIQAILTLREHCAAEAPPLEGEAESALAASNEAPQREVLQTYAPEAGTPQEKVQAASQAEASSKVCQEIKEYPLASLKKVLGNKQLQVLVNQAMSGIMPQIQYASVVTVRLPVQEAGSEIVVKLLSPLEYSACTCHKKEMCVHKAAAMLWCKLDTKTLAIEELAEGATEERSYDMEKVSEAAAQMEACLEELFAIGLSRTSQDASDYLERLAVISHNAGLARFEGHFRALFDSYGKYFNRNAVFQASDLMGQMTRMYRRVKLLKQAKDSAEVEQYAGEFRAEYIPAGKLSLIGIAMEHFESQTGYEGETVYFLEENTKQWYTLTNARPVFYEGGERRRATEKGQAPWGLGISLEELLNTRIRLTAAKCDERRRLSSSQDTTGEVLGKWKPSPSELSGWYYEDFGALFSEQIGKQQKEWLIWDSYKEEANLVFVNPDSFEKADFSRSGQQLSQRLYDKAGHEIILEVTYSKEEAGTIRYLERLSEKKLPCFIGKVYLKEGRIRMRPVTVWENFSRQQGGSDGT